MAQIAGSFGVPVPLSASGVVKNAQGALLGFACSTSTSGTIDLYDSATGATGTHFLVSFPVTAGQFVALPAGFSTGCYATLTNCTGTFFYA